MTSRLPQAGCWVIDAANVVGSRPTGWWRDRPGATVDWAERVRATNAEVVGAGWLLDQLVD